MRIISYFVSFVALILVLNIILSFASPSYKNFLKDVRRQYFKQEEIPILETKAKTDVNEKIIKSIEKLNDHINKIEISKKDEEIKTIIDSNSGSIKVDELEKIPESIKAKLTKLNLIKTENNGIFGLNKIDKDINYTTYRDSTSSYEIYIFESSYEAIMNLFKADKTYALNETNNFFGFGFYLNSRKKDDKVRFVIKIEGKSIGFQVIKNNYENLKNTLLIN